MDTKLTHQRAARIPEPGSILDDHISEAVSTGGLGFTDVPAVTSSMTP
jgi:hypothetical protein